MRKPPPLLLWLHPARLHINLEVSQDCTDRAGWGRDGFGPSRLQTSVTMAPHIEWRRKGGGNWTEHCFVREAGREGSLRLSPEKRNAEIAGASMSNPWRLMLALRNLRSTPWASLICHNLQQPSILAYAFSNFWASSFSSCMVSLGFILTYEFFHPFATFYVLKKPSEPSKRL